MGNFLTGGGNEYIKGKLILVGFVEKSKDDENTARIKSNQVFISIGGLKMTWGTAEKKGETREAGTGRVVEVRSVGKGASGEAQQEFGKAKDLAGGMEMLELDFLLGVIEHTSGADKNDVAMRKLSFNEVLRREQQDHIDSTALSVYAVDGSNLYGKDIQCEAMKELTKRTTGKGKGGG